MSIPASHSATHRLAIIDLAGGAQPRVDEATGDALVFNGEIYGYRALADELRAAGVTLCDRSDTEVLFQLIRRDGVRDAVAQIDGMFAFAFRDGATGALHLVRDRFGEKPLYWGLARGQLVFASEVSALVVPSGVSRYRARSPRRLSLSAVRISAANRLGMGRDRAARTRHDPDLARRADRGRALLAAADRAAGGWFRRGDRAA